MAETKWPALVLLTAATSGEYLRRTLLEQIQCKNLNSNNVGQYIEGFNPGGVSHQAAAQSIHIPKELVIEGCLPSWILEVLSSSVGPCPKAVASSPGTGGPCQNDKQSTPIDGIKEGVKTIQTSTTTSTRYLVVQDNGGKKELKSDSEEGTMWLCGLAGYDAWQIAMVPLWTANFKSCGAYC